MARQRETVTRGNKRYKLYTNFSNKSGAQKMAKDLRKFGHNAIVKDNPTDKYYKYAVYWRKRRK